MSKNHTSKDLPNMETEICLFFCRQKQTVKKAENARGCEPLLSSADQGIGIRVNA